MIFCYISVVKNTQHLLDKFIAAICRIDAVVVSHQNGVYVSPEVYTAIRTAKYMLPLLDDFAVKNRVVALLHDVYKDLRKDIKTRGTEINGQKHPALDPSLQAYRIIIS